MKLSLLQKALAASRAGRAAVLVTHLKSGQQSFIEGSEASGDLALDQAALAAIREAVTEDRNVTIDTAAGPVFVEVFNPRLRCIIVGAVHIAQPLARMASLAGYLVTVVDPRTAFASPERFPDVKVIAEWPDEALPRLNVDRYTAFVALTHDPKIDDPALRHALARDCFYIGALGSRKTHARRVERLKGQGVSETAIARIHAPIGLDIGAVSPAEIAIAIMAQGTERLHAAADIEEASGERVAATAAS